MTIHENNLPEAFDAQAYQMMQSAADFEVSPCTVPLDFADKSRFTQLELSPAQKMQVSALVQQIPSALAANAVAQAYTISFPKGLPHTLTTLKQGGYGSMVRGADGKFLGSASFHEMTAQGAVMGAFSAMSVVTGQYFLTQINSELKMMNLKFDKILEFLYGEKKAELMAEVSFAMYAYQNYNSIMSHEAQQSATIISLQEAKKVAMKDIEFYMGDLKSTAEDEAKNFSELETLIAKAYQIRECLALSTQLYIMSSMLELYYAQNHDKPYLENLKQAASVYLTKCDKRMLSSFSVLKHRVDEYKASITEKLAKLDVSAHEKKLAKLIDQLNNGEESEMHKTLRAALSAANQKAEYYLTCDGKMYTRTA